MTDIILHHYNESPFSEKVRLILGLKQASWKSVITPIILPKPDMTALTGGYRRAPVLQIGSDVYCDTALIARVLDRLFPAQPLFPVGQQGAGEILAQWSESTLFMTGVSYFYQCPPEENMIAKWPPEQAKAYYADRAALLNNPTFPSFAETAAHIKSYFDRLEDQLGHGQNYLLGNTLSIADLSCYHPLWFLRTMPSAADLIAQRPRLHAWMARIDKIGHGQVAALSAEDALAIAKRTPAAPLDPGHIDLPGYGFGDLVEVLPTDNGFEPTRGNLVAMHANEFVLRREDPRAGSVTVHFPRIGYQIKKA